MSWRDSLWAAAAVASHLGSQAQSNLQETFQAAAAKAQATIHDYQQTPQAPLSPPPSHSDTNGHHPSSPPSPPSSLSSLATSLSTLPSSLSSLSLPSSLPSFSSLLSAPPLSPHSPPSDELTHLMHVSPSPTPIAIDAADLDDLPPLVITRSTSLAPIKLFTGRPSDDSSALRAPPPRPSTQRRELLGGRGGVEGGGEDSKESREHLQMREERDGRLRAAQDEMMEDMRGSIARLGELSADIGGEVREQDEMLKEMGEEMDESAGLMELNRKKIERILQGAPRYHLYIIAALSLVATVLFYEVFFA